MHYVFNRDIFITTRFICDLFSPPLPRVLTGCSGRHAGGELGVAAGFVENWGKQFATHERL